MATAASERRRLFTVPDPSTAPDLLGWWQVERGTITASGAVTGLTDLKGNAAHNAQLISGVDAPARVASAALGGKAALRYSRSTAGCGLYFPLPWTLPFTCYIAMAFAANVGIYQIFFDTPTQRPRLYTYPGGPPDGLVINGGNQVVPGVNMGTSGLALAQVWRATGQLTNVAKSSETPDYEGDLGATTTSGVGFNFGINGGNTPVYAFAGDMAEILWFGVAHAKEERRRWLNYLNSRYFMPIDSDPPGSIYRVKMNRSVYADNVAATVPVSACLTATGALRLQMRGTVAGASYNTRLESLIGQWNAGAGPAAYRRGSPAGVAAVVGSVENLAAANMASVSGEEAELFVALGGGMAPEVAHRDGSGLGWLRAAMTSAATSPAIVGATGNLLVGADGVHNSLNRILREVVAYRDAAYPPGLPDYAAPQNTIVSGTLALFGNTYFGNELDGGLALYTSGRIAKDHALPRTYAVVAALISAIDATALDATPVSGGVNTLCVYLGQHDIVVGSTPATAYAALKTFLTARRANGWGKIIVGTLISDAVLTRANADAFNALLRQSEFVPAYADALADFAADATIGAVNYSSTAANFPTTTSLSGLGARLFSAVLAPVVSGLLA